MNLPDAHTHSSTAASGTAPRFICGTSPADWKQVALLAERDEHVTPFFGIHPWFLNPAEWKEEMPRLESLLQKIPHAGVGETGLDKCRRGIPGLPLQKEALERHLELAVRLDRGKWNVRDSLPPYRSIGWRWNRTGIRKPFRNFTDARRRNWA